MPDLAALLRDEIRRLARKEVKAQMVALKRLVTQHRQEISQLKKRLDQQEKRLAFLESQERKRVAQPEVTEEKVDSSRFSARSVRAQRNRLKLSAEQYARLVGVSPQTIYLWEQGKSRPRNKQMAALIAVRGLGRREALERLKLLSDADENSKSQAPQARRKKRTKNDR
jgi:DNA-binding transcriptional regulator YiaG